MNNGKKLLTILIAGIITLGMAGCIEEGPGMSNVENVNSVLRVTSLTVDREVDLYDGTTVSNENVYFSTEILVDQAAPEQDSSTMTGVHFTQYKVDYMSDDPDAVDLASIKLPIQAYIEPGDKLTLSGYLAMPAERKQNFTGVIAPESTNQIPYEFRFTFYGENQFGQEVEVQCSDYTLFGDF